MRESRLPRLLTLAVVLTLLTFGWMGWTAYAAYHFVTVRLPAMTRMEDLRGQILLMDEVLTMSARMSAATGDPKWEARYRQIDPKLTAAIKEVMRLAPEASQGNGASQTDDANGKLVAMEYRSFDLVRAGRQVEAQRLLASTEYEAQKKVYARGMGELSRLLKQTADSARLQRQTQVFWTSVTAGMSGSVLVVIWWIVLRNVRRWRQALVESNLLLNQQAAELRQFAQNLDEKVAERTTQLEESRASTVSMMEEAVVNRKMVEEAYEALKHETVERTKLEEQFREQAMMLDQTRKQSLEELETRVEERTAALAQSNDDLQLAKESADAANLAKSGFLSRMSHELRTPMNAILGFGQLLEMSKLDGRQSEGVGYIMKAGRHLLGLINDVLDVTRVDLGSVGLSLEPVDVDCVILESIALIRPLADKDRISIEFDSRGPVYARADRQRLRQVLLNLLSNAVKYNATEGRVTIVLDETIGIEVGIVVLDTGAGISPDMLGKIFTPFERLDAAGKGIEGTGLGLGLSKTLAEAMGGQLTAESKVGEGSSFRILLAPANAPWADISEQELDGAQRSAAPGARTRKVLVIEDNVTNAELLSRIFDPRDDIELIIAMQGRLGLELAAEHLPDLVLLDLHLPDMRGQDVLREIHANPKLKDIPVVVVSADAFQSQSDELLRAGALAYITKPFVLTELMRVVDTALYGDHLAA